jgi:metal-sulfur cluster biosynthetic enzyme
MQARVIDALREVIDPELGLNVVDLGLVHDVDVDGAANVLVNLLMPTPAYLLSEQIVLDAGRRVRALAGVHSADVRLVREPIWSPDRMSQAARDARPWHR